MNRGDALIRDNDIHDNTTGLAIVRASPIVEGNTIRSNATGLAARGPDVNPIMSGNTVCGNETNLDVERVSSGSVDTSGNEVCTDEPVQ